MKLNKFHHESLSTTFDYWLERSGIPTTALEKHGDQILMENFFSKKKRTKEEETFISIAELEILYFIRLLHI